MAAKIAVLLFGLLYLLAGIAGLFPACVHLPPPQVHYYQMHMFDAWGYLFSWLPVNEVHSVLYMILGGIGVLASCFRITAIGYAKAMFFLMLIFTVIGLLPLGASELGGIIPLFDWNVMLHSVTAMLLYYYGFIYPIDRGGAESPDQMLAPAV